VFDGAAKMVQFVGLTLVRLVDLVFFIVSSLLQQVKLGYLLLEINYDLLLRG